MRPPRLLARRLTTTSSALEQAMPTVEQYKNHISVLWTDGEQSTFHHTFLRTACGCVQCKHPSGQKIISPATVPAVNDISQLTEMKDALQIVWSNEQHETQLSWDWLRNNCYTRALERRQTIIPPFLKARDSIPSIQYEQLETGGDAGLFQLLQPIIQSGLCMVRGVPTVKGKVKEIAEKIAPISHSALYGQVFDVKAELQPVNIAYSTEKLDYHMDLAYYESPPGLQFLHCIQFDDGIRGGESRFVDVFQAAERLRATDPEAFKTLCRVPATFLKRHLTRAAPAFMEYQRPHISVNHHNEVTSVFWSPPFEGALKVPVEDMDEYYRAYRAFYNVISDPEISIETRLHEGDLIIFNQRRLLHARTAFQVDSVSTRHLQGTYVDIDDAYCRYRVLAHKLDKPDQPYRIANSDYA